MEYIQFMKRMAAGEANGGTSPLKSMAMRTSWERSVRSSPRDRPRQLSQSNFRTPEWLVVLFGFKGLEVWLRAERTLQVTSLR